MTAPPAHQSTSGQCNVCQATRGSICEDKTPFYGGDNSTFVCRTPTFLNGIGNNNSNNSSGTGSGNANSNISDKTKYNGGRNAFDEEEEYLLSRLCNSELHAFYNYLALYAHYDRDEVALKGFAKYYLRQAYDELNHTLKLIAYMNKRGGRVKFCEIKAPERQNWCTARDGIQTAMDVERQETCHLVELHNMASEKNDHHLSNYLVENFIGTQLDAMNELVGRYSQLGMVGEGPGLYIYDRHLKKAEKKRSSSK